MPLEASLALDMRHSLLLLKSAICMKVKNQLLQSLKVFLVKTMLASEIMTFVFS